MYIRNIYLTAHVNMYLILLRWRTKQNLDYAYLMMYAQAKGTFYVQVSLNFCNKY